MVNTQDAIQNLEQGIALKERQIEQLNKFEQLVEAGLTEEQYHDFCSTDMRNSDTLGEALLKVFPFLSYDKRQPNFFHYTVEDLEIRIPNNRSFGIEIIVKKYYSMPNEENIALSHGLLSSKKTIEGKIKTRQEYLEAKSFSKKARLMFPHLKSWAAFISYVSHNIKWIFKFDKKRISPSTRIKNELEELLWEQEKFVAKEKLLTEQAESSYLEQQTLLEKYALLFLKWTKNVRVYSNNWDKPKADYSMENGSLKLVLD